MKDTVLVEVKIQEIIEAVMKSLNEEANLVEVVRCNDCAFYDSAFAVRKESGELACRCMNFEYITDPDFFCAWGERREET